MSKFETDTIKQLVKDQLELNGALKGTVLVTEVSKELYSKRQTSPTELADSINLDIPAIINQMVMDKEIYEVEYVLADTNRIKSIYFPTGTELRVITV